MDITPRTPEEEQLFQQLKADEMRRGRSAEDAERKAAATIRIERLQGGKEPADSGDSTTSR